jgi:hypothetical protein
MVIEIDARRYIVDSVVLEQKLTDFEGLNQKRGQAFIKTNLDYNELRINIISKICEMNAIANTQGKGRDDFTLEIL